MLSRSLSGKRHVLFLSVMKSGKESTGVVGRVAFKLEIRIVSWGEGQAMEQGKGLGSDQEKLG